MVAVTWCLWDNSAFCVAWWIERVLLPLTHTRTNFYGSVYSEIEKMKVYRDSPDSDFLAGAREILGATVDMTKLEEFHGHVEKKVEALKCEIKGSTSTPAKSASS